MTITIKQQGSTYYIYKDLKIKDQPHDFYAQNTTSNFMPNGREAHVYLKEKEELGYVWIKYRLFRRTQLQLILSSNGKPLEIIPENVWSWKDLIWKFEFCGAEYVFQEHRGHFRTLYKNNKQVAAFEKSNIGFMGRDVFIIYANNDENIVLLSCLAIYNDLPTHSRNAYIISSGNLNGTNPPLNGKWRPGKS